MDSPPFKFSTVFLPLLTTIALLASLFALSQQMLHHSEQLQVNQALREMASSEQQLKDQIQTLQASNTTVLSQLASAQANLTQMQNLVGSADHAWQMNEAFHLLRLADYTLYFEHNIPVTIILLKAADQSLSASQNVSLLKIRGLVAQDLALLEAIPVVDLPAVYLQLQIVSEAAAKLPLVSDQFTAHQTDNLLAPQVAVSQNWWQGFSRALATVLILRRHDQVVAPLLSAQEKQMVLLNVQSLFLEAEWGLMHHQARIYQNSLAAISTLLNQYFIINNPEVNQIQAALTDLEKVDVEPTLPNLSNILRAMKADHVGGQPA